MFFLFIGAITYLIARHKGLLNEQDKGVENKNPSLLGDAVVGYTAYKILDDD